MASPREKLTTCDPVWASLRTEAETMAEREPALAGFVHATILEHDRLENALSYHMAKKLGGEDLSPLMTRQTFEEAMAADPEIGAAMRADLSAVFERDPACNSYVEAFLYYKGFHALQCYRVAHWLWRQDRHAMALFLQSRISELFAVDIHPAAKMGRGIMIDHGTGVVIGETAVVEDDVSMLHGVTLGGTGKETHGFPACFCNVCRFRPGDYRLRLFAGLWLTAVRRWSRSCPSPAGGVPPVCRLKFRDR